MCNSNKIFEVMFNPEQSSEEAYDAGLKDGRVRTWEMVKLIFGTPEHGGLTIDELKEIFGTNSTVDIVENMPLDEVIKRLDDWHYKLHHGVKQYDIVKCAGPHPGLVTRDHVNDDYSLCYVLFGDGSFDVKKKRNLEVIGHCDYSGTFSLINLCMQAAMSK